MSLKISAHCAGEAVVDQPGVLAGGRVGIEPALGGIGALLVIAQVGEVGVVHLHIAAAGVVQRAQLIAVGARHVVVESRVEVGIGLTADAAAAAAEMQAIAGQKPVIAKAKKSIAQFKLREGMPIGCKVTLRRDRMYEFLDRLVTIALPRVRDFRGLNPRSFDGRGNYAMGLKEQIIFPEISYDNIETIWGMDIIVCTTAKSDDEARALLRAFNFPFRQ